MQTGRWGRRGPSLAIVAACALWAGCSSGGGAGPDGGTGGAAGATTATGGRGGTGGIAASGGTGGVAIATGGQIGTGGGSGGSTGTGGAPLGALGSDSGICSTAVTCSTALCRGSLCEPTYAWSIPLPNCGPSIAPVPAGGVVVASAGYDARPGGGISPGSPAVPGYAVNVDADGNVRWQHSYVPNGDLDPEVVGLAVLSDGSTVLFVRNGYEQFDSASGLQYSIDANPVFAAKWSPLGNYDWVKTFPSTNSDGSMQIAAMAGGPGDTITFVGSYTGSVNLDFDGVAPPVGTYSGTNPLPAAIFVVQDSGDGRFGWVQSFASSGDSGASGVAVGSDGAIDLTGSFAGTGPFGQAGSTFLAHLSPTGTLGGAGTWVDDMAGLSSPFPFGWWTVGSDGSLFFEVNTSNTSGSIGHLAADGRSLWSVAGASWSGYNLTAPGPLIVFGKYDNSVDLQLGHTVPNFVPPDSDAPFIAAYGLDGTPQWLRQPPLPVSAVTVTADGSIYYVSGAYQGAVDLDPSPDQDVMSSSTPTCYLTKLVP